MSQNPNLLFLSHLEDACGHLVFKNFAFQTSRFPCLCIQRNRWWKPQGEKANKIQSPPFQPSQCYHLIHIDPQMTFKWDQRFASGGTRPGCTVICTVTSGRSGSWKSSTFGHSLPRPVAWVTFMPIVCSVLGGKCWLSCTLQSLWFCGLLRLFLPAWPKYKNFSTISFHSASQNYWNLAWDVHQGLAKGASSLEEFFWTFVWLGIKGIATQRAF